CGIAMLGQLTGFSALVLYAGLALWQWRAWQRQTVPARQAMSLLATLALGLHAISVYTQIDTVAGFNFGFFHVSSLIFWVVCITIVISSFKLPVGSLLAPVFAMTSLSIACSLFLDSPYTPQHDLGYPIAGHILLSILAYSILTIASAQALALALQDRLLKERQFQKAMALLPPLQTMEALLFEMLWAGTVLLALSIASGLLFFNDMRAQHLAHKMFFSLVALAVYAVLLWGRHQRGWRGRQAIHWTLGGFAALMLAYFGTKFVLEFILHLQ
ncbi:MAG TPA: cytochrome c biogenesis protein CcsA, partial [Pseudomonadales bacterium]|nr:cytochrome c biogenesis protein CcsA [Pseudomonadales bacterium]